MELLHVVVSGNPDGLPVLLSGGLGAAWFDWDLVADELADGHRLIRFDRAGTGTSGEADGVPSLRSAVRELAELAETVGARVTLVAHSMAALHAEALARIRPELLRGLVLVDPSYEPDLRVRLRLANVLAPAYRMAGAVLDVTRLARVLGPLARRWSVRRASVRGEVVPEAEIIEVYGRGRVLAEIALENQAYREMASDLVALRSRRPFPQIPLVVLTATADGGPASAHDRAELAAMSPLGRHVELPESRHMVPFDRPDAVAEAVRWAEAGGWREVGGWPVPGGWPVAGGRTEADGRAEAGGWGGTVRRAEER
jgi:pimeloyl-ACP methyl ester carboxylesterase